MKTFHLPETPTRQHSSLYNVALLFTLASFLTMIVEFSLYFRSEPRLWQLAIAATLSLFTGIIGLISVQLIRRGQPSQGAWLLIGITSLVALIIPFFIDNLGLLLGPIFFFLNVGVFSQNLPQRQLPWVLLIGLGTNIMAVFTDVFLAKNQIALPLLQNLINGLAIGFFLLTFSWLIRQFNSYPLFNKLLILFLLVAILPIIAITYINATTNRTNLTNQQFQTLLATASETADELDTFFITNQNITQTEAKLINFVQYLELPTAQQPGSELEIEVLDMLNDLRSRDAQFIASYALLNARGINVADTDSRSVGSDESFQNYFLEVIHSKTSFISPVQFSSEDKTASLYFSSPVQSETGEVLGVLRLQYQAEVLQKIITSQSGLLGEDSFAYLVDDNYLFLAQGERETDIFKTVVPLTSEEIAVLQAVGRMPIADESALSVNIPTLAAALDQAEERPFYQEDDIDEQVDAGAITRLQTQPWYVIYEQSNELTLASIDEQIRNSLLLTLVITAIIAIIAFVTAQYLTTPINHLTAVASQLAAGNYQIETHVKSQDEIGLLAATFNQMSHQLQETLGTLAQRNQAIETSVDMGRRLSSILDPQQLVQEVVTQVQKTLGYYSVQIYLFDENKQNLVLASGTGEAGRLLLAAGHQLPLDHSSIGQAAQTNQPILIPDLSQDKKWQSNPLLPDSKSEIILPITIGNQVMGVLNVQHNVANGLQQLDADILQLIANQVATALQNARAYEQIRRKAEQEALINTINQRIESATTLEGVLDIAARELRRTLGARHTVVELSQNPDNGHYHVR